MTDGLSQVTDIYRKLAQTLEHPPRVLDLGCAQGAVSVALAERGATVHGVDARAENIAACNALAVARPGLKITFQHSLIEGFIVAMNPGDYDLVVGLDAFDGLIGSVGAELVQKIISVLAGTTLIGIYRLAAPQPRALLADYTFVHRAGAVYVASNRYWFLDGSAGAFDTWKDISRGLANGGICNSRRCFMGNGVFVKQFTLDLEERRSANLQEYSDETALLTNPPAGFKTPELLSHGRHEGETWIVREMLPGDLLSERIKAEKPYDAARIIQDVLAQLAALESAGLYHNDLRVWNLVVDAQDRTSVIDYAAISPRAADPGWPYNIFLSFVIFLGEIVHRKVLTYDPIRQASFNPETFPEPYRSALWELFGRDPATWSFAFLRDYLSRPQQDTASAQPGFAAVLTAMEEAGKTYREMAHYWKRQAGLAHTLGKQLQDEVLRMRGGKTGAL